MSTIKVKGGGKARGFDRWTTLKELEALEKTPRKQRTWSQKLKINRLKKRLRINI